MTDPTTADEHLSHVATTTAGNWHRQKSNSETKWQLAAHHDSQRHSQARSLDGCSAVSSPPVVELDMLPNPRKGRRLRKSGRAATILSSSKCERKSQRRWTEAVYSYMKKITVNRYESNYFNPHSVEVGGWGQCFESSLAALTATIAHISLSRPRLAYRPGQDSGRSTSKIEKWRAIGTRSETRSASRRKHKKPRHARTSM